MGEIESAARGAKERLVAALSLLDLPEDDPAGADIALPISRAIGALHRLETSQVGGPRAAILARDSIRKTLAALQEVGTAARIPEEMLELVAGCLGIAHQLSEILTPAAPEGPGPRSSFEQVPVDRRSAGAPPVHSQSWRDQAAREPRHPTARSRQAPEPEPARPRPGAHIAAPGGVTMMKSEGNPDPRGRRTRDSHAAQRSAPLSSQTTPGGLVAPDADHDLGSTRMSRQEASVRMPESLDTTRVSLTHDQASPKGAGAALRGSAEDGYRSSPGARKRHGQTMESPSLGSPTSKHARGPNTIPKADAMVFEANLGAHSATNFYKGLSGNDVVDHGGIFVASYQVPTIGTPLWLKVTMPGGYDFEASARVAWTRDGASPDAPPGFGAKFDKLSDEARHLVYRYARNREPLFHDDL